MAAGKLLSDPASLTSVPQVRDSRVDVNGYADFSPLRVLAAMKSFPSHNGCGPIVLPAELLKASGMEGASRSSLCSGKEVGKLTS